MANIFSRLFTRKNKNNNSLPVFLSGSDNYTGNDATSFAAMDLICSSFASLSYSFFNRETKEALKDYPLYRIIKNPNADEGAFQFWYHCAKDYLNGNCYLLKVFNSGEIISLFRLNPNAVRVRRDITDNKKIFSYSGIDYTSAQILHIPSRFGYDGNKGRSIFDECGKIFNNTKEIDNYVNNSFTNSIGNRLVIDISKETNEHNQEKIDDLKRLFLQNYTGARNAGVPLIKSGKIEYNTIQTDYKDNRASQLIENREFQEREIAKIFGVPLALLNGKTENNLESVYTTFIEMAIRPLATSFEEAVNRIMPLYDREIISFEYSYNSLLKTSLTTRIDAYIKQLNNGVLSHNEVRRKENLDEINEESANCLFIPSTLMPLRDNVVDAYMSGAQLKLQEIQEKENQHSATGDDKQ